MPSPGLVSPVTAANAYGASQGISGVGQLTNAGAKIPGGSQNDSDFGGVEVSFSDLLKQNVSSSVETIKAGEEMSAKAITGEANITDVVQAVTNAELTLQTLVSVRDRMISAYQDIMRMPI